MFKYAKRGNGTPRRQACFKCCLAFSMVGRNDTMPCSVCGEPTHYVGTSFRAPRRQDKRRWKVLEKLVLECGYIFHNSGHGYIPKNAREVDFLLSVEPRQEKWWQDTRGRSRSYVGRMISEGFSGKWKDPLL